VINFNDMEQSCSKLGGIYEIPPGMNENSLSGLSLPSQFSSPVKTSVPQPIPIWDAEEIEVFSLTLYK